MNFKILNIILFLLLFNISYSQEYLKFNNIDTAILKKNIEINKIKNINQHNNSLLDLIDLYIISGNIETAYNELIKINPEQLTYKTKARYIDLKGLIYFNNSDFEQAKLLWDKSYKTKQSIFDGDSSIFASTYLYYSKYYMQVRNYEKSFYYSKKALSVLKQNNKEFILVECNREYAYNLKVFNHSYKRNSFLIKSRKLFFKTIKLCEKLNYNFYIPQLYHDIGNTFTDIVGKYKANNNLELYNETYNNAHKYYDLDISIRNKYFSEKTELNGITWYTKGLLEYYSSKLKEKEIEFYNKAIKCYFPEYTKSYNLQQIKNKYQVLEILQFKIKALISIYDENQDTTLIYQAKNDVELSINIWQDILLNFKSFEISKVLGLDNTMPFNNAIYLSTELFNLTKNKKYINDVFQYSEMQKHAIINRDMLSKGGKIIKDNIISLDEVQQKIKKNEAIIEYALNRIILIKNDTVIIVKQSFNNKFIDTLLLSINKFDFQNFTKSSHSLYNRLILPIEKHLNDVTELTIIPYFKLGLVPFDCLIQELPQKNNQTYKSLQYLINNFKISYAYSATLKYLENDLPYNNKIFAITPKLNNNYALPFSEKLVSKLSDKYEGVYSQNHKIDFFNNVNNFNIIHIATHTNLNNDDNNKSKIIIGKNKNIEIESFYKHKIKSQLAVVLACESATGEIYRGDQTNSFVRAFKYAGVSSIISTLWKVDDKSSNEILDYFYQNLLEENNNISTSLHKAKIQYLANAKTDEECNPYYWAGIIFTGSDVKIKITKNYNYTAIAFSIIGIISIFIFLIMIYRNNKSIKL